LKWVLITGFLGWFLIRSEVENLVTKYIPNSWEIYIGIGLLVYTGYRLKDKRW